MQGRGSTEQRKGGGAQNNAREGEYRTTQGRGSTEQRKGGGVQNNAREGEYRTT